MALWTGGRARIRVQFTDADTGQAADPGTVTISWKPPGGTEVDRAYVTDPEVVKDGIGNYYVIVDLDTPGTWTCRAEGTDPVDDAIKGSFLVRDSSL